MASDIWDYRRWIKAEVEKRVQAGEDISFSKLASHTRIQRTYLSQVINHKHHLNNDQLYAISMALHLLPEQRQYLQLMSEWERCKLEPRKQQLAERLHSLEAAHPLAYDASGLPPDPLDDYFCDPLAEIVLKFLSIKKTPPVIRECLGLSLARCDEILQTLEKSGLIERNGDGIRVIRSSVFPPENSPAERIRNIQGRLKVSHNKLKQRHIDEFMYNWWFISHPERKKELKIKYLHLLQDIYRESLTVPHEHVYQLTIDLITP
ncbi:MAG: DUF4423 domain-containing protein [Pseudobdellovibrionaceae bacterium]|nr:DUF4423 domain-containing protein [Pseudobdellovibrionaceae bacterium]